MYVHLYYLHELIKILLKHKNIIGNIVAISTPLTTYYNKKNYLYISSKVAMEHYIKQLAYNEGVLANIISPGYFRSKMNKYQPPSFDVDKLPLAREISAKEIAEYIYKFIKENKLLIGQQIILDGGATLGY